MDSVFWIKAAQLLLSLSILIVLHEFGHYLTARWFKIRVEKFYLFFNPWFSLFKKKIGDTTWGIGWLPLGGYVKIAGMVDETTKADEVAEEPKPDEFRSKPAWQRLIVMAGGVIVNLILGIVIYIFIMFVYGKDYLAVEDAKFGVIADSLMIDNGFQMGDVILEVGGEKPETFGEINTSILIDRNRDVKVDRNGEIVTITLPDDIDQDVLKYEVGSLFSPRFPAYIEGISKKGNAHESGLEKRDKLIAVNDVQTPFIDQFRAEIIKNKAKEVTVHVERDGKPMSYDVLVDSTGMIGIAMMMVEEDFEFTHIDYTFGEAIPAGFDEGIGKLTMYVKSMRLLATKEGIGKMGGFGAIGSMFPDTWKWESFWSITAFISIILAFMNILPIPALDGGYILFLIYEMISGREVPTKVIEKANMVGFFFLIALILYANGNDVAGLFGD